MCVRARIHQVGGLGLAVVAVYKGVMGIGKCHRVKRKVIETGRRQMQWDAPFSQLRKERRDKQLPIAREISDK